VIEMVGKAIGDYDRQLALVMGGFHLSSSGRREVEAVAAGLTALGVGRVAPCHCTGDLARQVLSRAFESNCYLAGVGWSISLDAADDPA
jgi:7,8-dihydropterin-6-yl-methyl-4-(beta-D-ribofuranosyl)aminobenzene 5'-phosphate synthase